MSTVLMLPVILISKLLNSIRHETTNESLSLIFLKEKGEYEIILRFIDQAIDQAMFGDEKMAVACLGGGQSDGLGTNFEATQ